LLLSFLLKHPLRDHVISSPPHHLSKKILRVRASLCLCVSLNDKYISDETLREQPDMILSARNYGDALRLWKCNEL